MKDEKKAFEDFLEFFADKLSGADVIAARELGKISAIIAKERIDRGLNQKDFAKLLNVSQSMVSKWESENYNFTIENLEYKYSHPFTFSSAGKNITVKKIADEFDFEF